MKSNIDTFLNYITVEKGFSGNEKNYFFPIESKKEFNTYHTLVFQFRKRDKLKNSVYGSIVRVDLDNSHPLAFGYKQYYHNLKLEKTLYPLLSMGWNVGILKDPSSVVAGFMGYKIKRRIKNHLIFGVHETKKGKVKYGTGCRHTAGHRINHTNCSECCGPPP